MGTDESCYTQITKFLDTNQHLSSLKFSNLQIVKESEQVNFSGALKMLPLISNIEFDRCFNDVNGYIIGGSVFMALKHRGRSLRNLSLIGTQIGESNLFSLCGLANRGYISESLILDV